MGTLVCFHAHPDDESITTGGTIARAAAQGNRVVLVLATSGEHGESPADLTDGETLGDRRRSETLRSAEVLGVSRVEFLGYSDSGMTGWDQNGHHEAFINAPPEEAAERLAAILREEQATTLTTYDWHGNYGHPDHIAVHRVGHAAAKRAGTPNVYEVTMNRDAVLRFIELARAADPEMEFDPNDTDDGVPMGMAEADLTTAVDVGAFIERKKASIGCHASQVSDASFFMQMTDEVFLESFGTEWFIHVGEPGGIREDWLAGLS